jgi:hypothetical protein
MEIEVGDDGNVLMDSDEQPDHETIVQMLVKECEERQALQQKLDEVQAQKQTLQVFAEQAACL